MEIEVVDRGTWTAARKNLLAREKAFTRARDELNAERRRLPVVRIDKDYRNGWQQPFAPTVTIQDRGNVAGCSPWTRCRAVGWPKALPSR